MLPDSPKIARDSIPSDQIDGTQTAQFLRASQEKQIMSETYKLWVTSDDVTNTLYDVMLSLYDVMLALYDVMLALYDVMLAFYDVMLVL